MRRATMAVILGSTLLCVMSLVAAAVVAAQSAPAFNLGFKALADQIPTEVGVPLENEHWGSNGDSLQQTSTGLMAWRKADNWTAYTNGYMTWINGPNGVQSRLNADRFEWEQDPIAPTVAPTPTLDVVAVERARAISDYLIWWNATLTDADSALDLIATQMMDLVINGPYALSNQTSRDQAVRAGAQLRQAGLKFRDRRAYPTDAYSVVNDKTNRLGDAFVRVADNWSNETGYLGGYGALRALKAMFDADPLIVEITQKPTGGFYGVFIRELRTDPQAAANYFGAALSGGMSPTQVAARMQSMNVYRNQYEVQGGQNGDTTNNFAQWFLNKYVK